MPALEALAKLYDKLGRRRAVDRLHDARRRADAGHEAARRGVLPDRQGARREARRSRRGARALRDGARSRSVAPADARGAARRSRSTPPTTTRRRATSIRSRATRRRRGSARKLLVELGKLRERDARRPRERGARVGGGVRGGPARTRTRRCRSSTSTSRKESWAKAEPLLDLLVRKSGKRERGEQHDLQNKLGQVCAALGKDDKALKAYTAAHQLDLTDQVTIRGLAEVCFRLKDWGAALTNYQKVLTALGEDETDGARRRLLQARLHQARAGAGEAGDQQLREGARRSTRRTAPTLEALVSLYTELKDWKQVVAYKRQILDNVVRRRRALPHARTRSPTSGTIRTRTRARRSRRSKRRASCSRSTRRCSTSSSRSTRRPRTGRR